MAKRAMVAFLYQAARAASTVKAASHGPEALVKRRIRRRVYAHTNRIVGNLLRKEGL